MQLTKTLGLGDKEVGVHDTASTKSTPEPEDFRTEVGLVSADQVGL
jgi:hypothetical protein